MVDREKFKQTEIGRIPKEWEVVRLGEVFSLEYGKGLVEKERENGEYPVYGSNGVVGYHSQCIVKGPGIIIGRKGTIGAVTWSDRNFWPIDTTYYILLKIVEIDLKWLFYKLLSLKLAKLNMATGTPGLNRELVYKLKIPLPPLPEQQKIAEILSTVDEVIEKLDDSIEKTERFKKGLMHELLTKGIGHKEFKDTEIGRIPKEWKIVRLKEISLDFIGGGTPSTTNSDYWNGDIAWMTSAHINGREVVTGQRYITKVGLQNSATNVVPRCNLIVATRVGIGKVVINKIDIAISQDLTGVVLDKNSSSPYFLYWYITNNENILKSMAQGSTIKGILRESLGNLQLPLPPLPEQQKIAEILSTVDKRLELLRNKKEKLERIKKGLMNDLLTGQRRVKILEN